MFNGRFATTMSALPTSRVITSDACGWPRSRVIPRLLRLQLRNNPPSPLSVTGPSLRSSPPSRRSTRITSAPKSANNIAQYGPARKRPKSMTRIPSRGPAIPRSIVPCFAERRHAPRCSPLLARERCSRVDSMSGNLEPHELSLRTRSANLDRMRGEVFDVAVIGGGITGAGVALDAASRGLSVALIEKRDFASGTSSRSSKLIHGGLRYLEQFHFGLVRESLHERAVMSRMAPHLSRPLEFLVPIYSTAERSPLGANKLKLRAGLWLYDLLAGRRNVARHRWVSRDGALKLAPALEPSGLRGAFVYYDCLTDDARLVIEVIKAAAAHGAAIANYAAARGLRKNDDALTSVQIEDVLGGRSYELRGRVVVNAGGVWS